MFLARYRPSEGYVGFVGLHCSMLSVARVWFSTTVLPYSIEIKKQCNKKVWWVPLAQKKKVRLSLFSVVDHQNNACCGTSFSTTTCWDNQHKNTVKVTTLAFLTEILCQVAFSFGTMETNPTMYAAKRRTYVFWRQNVAESERYAFKSSALDTRRRASRAMNRYNMNTRQQVPRAPTQK